MKSEKVYSYKITINMRVLSQGAVPPSPRPLSLKIHHTFSRLIVFDIQDRLGRQKIKTSPTLVLSSLLRVFFRQLSFLEGNRKKERITMQDLLQQVTRNERRVEKGLNFTETI